MTNSAPFKMCSHRREGESRLKPLKYSGQYSRRDGSLQNLPNPKGQQRRLTATKEGGRVTNLGVGEKFQQASSLMSGWLDVERGREGGRGGL